MKKLEISITKDGVKVLGDGQELLNPKAISITMEGEEEQPQPTPEPTPQVGEKYTFDAWNPQVTHTRLTDREPLGLGADKSQFLDGKTSISGWHIWSLIADDDYIAYLCDGREYWRITNDQLHELTIQDDITFNVIFATNVIGTPKGNVEMQVDYVKFTPKE